MTIARRQMLLSAVASAAVTVPAMLPGCALAPAAASILKAASVYAHEAKVEADRLPRIMAYLDRCGATFEAVPGWPGWYAARWHDERNFGDHARRWACCADIEMDCEWPYALAFKARVEAGAQQ